MKTMNDFKGTKGEFEIAGNKIQVNPDDPMKTTTIAMLFGSMGVDENFANAKLFANSKKVLEAAIEDLNARFDYSLNIHDKALLNDKLKKAINDSL